ncbi:MAG: hypothetical protein ACYDAE_17345 [Steroidobacteraceae bacterium]
MTTGAKTAHGKKRPEYKQYPKTNRDPPTRGELAKVAYRSGAKSIRKREVVVKYRVGIEKLGPADYVICVFTPDFVYRVRPEPPPEFQNMDGMAYRLACAMAAGVQCGVDCGILSERIDPGAYECNESLHFVANEPGRRQQREAAQRQREKYYYPNIVAWADRNGYPLDGCCVITPGPAAPIAALGASP